MKTIAVVLILSFILLTASMLLLGINVFFTKKRKFPNTHVSGNKALRDKGIHCATTQDREERKKKNLFELMDKQTNAQI
ncbi:cytochrome c-type biogenesis protein CcmE [Dysgonomonadaceae bacterium PH5-43]|nr:cytochrome c-type biogenesis protein CcmE [Dysgonomonadaceae bacterium PH5-43]